MSESSFHGMLEWIFSPPIAIKHSATFEINICCDFDVMHAHDITKLYHDQHKANGFTFMPVLRYGRISLLFHACRGSGCSVGTRD